MTAENSKIRICILSSVPVTLWSFYRGLIHQLQDGDFEVTLISSDFPELHKMKNELDCNIFATTISRQISPLSDIISICKLTRYLYRRKFKIIHAHTPKGGLIGMISAWLARIPNRIYTVHGLPLETATGLKRKLLWLAEWVSCKLATKLLAVSPSLRQRVIDVGICPAEKICVLGHGSACGINTDIFSPSEHLAAKGKKIRAQYNIPYSAVVIGYVGRIVPDKGIKTLTDSFVHLQQQHKNLHLLFAGRFDDVREVLNPETAKTIEYGKKIHWVGYIEDPVPFYATMDILTLPSRREGFGLTLLEAAAMELPTIATKVTGCVDAVVEGETGLLVDAEDSRQFYEAMLKLVKDPKLRKKLGGQGRQRVEKLFDSRVLIEKHIDLYKGLFYKEPKS